MPEVYMHAGQVLLNDSKVAVSQLCCCGGDPCTVVFFFPFIIDDLSGVAVAEALAAQGYAMLFFAADEFTGTSYFQGRCCNSDPNDTVQVQAVGRNNQQMIVTIPKCLGQ